MYQNVRDYIHFTLYNRCIKIKEQKASDRNKKSSLVIIDNPNLTKLKIGSNLSSLFYYRFVHITAPVYSTNESKNTVLSFIS